MGRVSEDTYDCFRNGIGNAFLVETFLFHFNNEQFILPFPTFLPQFLIILNEYTTHCS